MTFFFRKTRRYWWGGHGDWKSCGYTGITDSTSSLSVFVRLLFYFVVFFFFGGDKQVAHLTCHTWQLTDEFSLALISRRPTCVASCNWKCFAIGSSGSPAHLRLIADILKFARNAHQTGAIFNHFTCKYRSNRLKLEYVRRCCSQPTSTGFFVKLNSAQLRRQVGCQCLQQIMIWR